MPSSKIALNQAVGRDKHTLELLRANEQHKLDDLKLQKKNKFLAEAGSALSKGKSRTTAISRSDPKYSGPVEAISSSRLDLDQVIDPATDDKIRAVQQRITELDRLWIEFEQAKYERTFRIPGTEASIGESEVKNSYPLALALALLVIGIYRVLLLKARNDDNFIPPFWAAPIPLGRYSLTFFRWLLLNVAGLALISICGLLFVNYSRRDEFFQSLAWTAVNTFTGLGVLAFFLWQSLRAIIPGSMKVQQGWTKQDEHTSTRVVS